MFDGNLITVGSYNIPLKFIKAESYTATLNIQDLDSFRDGNGTLHRTTVEHVPVTVEFETMPLNNNELNELMTGIRNNYLIELERKVNASVYVPETDNYITQEMYLVQPKPKINYVDANSKIVYYQPLRIAFVGY